ncbi:MAG: PilW family protein [Vulcanimicrobiota bacterium]
MLNCQFLNLDYNKRQQGFTLLEVIITVGLALMTLAAVYSALYFGSQGSAETRVNIAKKQVLMRQFYILRRQLINIYSAEGGEVLLGEQGTAPRASELYFVTSDLENYQSIGEVGYKIEKDENGQNYLAYTEFPYPRTGNRFAKFNYQDEWKKASIVIQGFEVEYETQNLWRNEWKDSQLPDKIRVTFWYRENEQDPELSPYTFIVVPGIKSIF